MRSTTVSTAAYLAAKLNRGLWSATTSGEDFQLLAPTPTPVTKLVATADGSTLYGASTPSGTPSISGAMLTINVDGTGYRWLLTVDNAISNLALVDNRLLFPGPGGLYSIQNDASNLHRISTRPVGIHSFVHGDFIFGALTIQIYRMNFGCKAMALAMPVSLALTSGELMGVAA